MNIAVCENDAADCAALCAILDGYIKQNRYTAEIRTFESGELLLAEFTLGAFDLVFLDIYMDGINGIQTARRIRQIDPVCALIFITSSPNHALEGFSVRAAGYVVKPIREKEMLSALLQCQEVFMRNARYIEIRTDRTDIKLPLSSIFYVEVYNKTAHFHTQSGVYQTRKSMDDIEQELGGEPFYRCHQSYIINMNHIERITSTDIVMRIGSSVPMRQRGRDEIRSDIAQFVSSRLFQGSIRGAK